MSLTTTDDRTHRALASQLDRMNQVIAELTQVRKNLAYELGFDRKQPADLVKGDQVRMGHGGFNEVQSKRFVDDGCRRGYQVTFTDLSVVVFEVDSENHPLPAGSVTVAIPDEIDPF